MPAPACVVLITGMASRLLLSFYGDDFTGSTDALEALTRAGLRTVLFTNPPSAEQLSAVEGLQAFGIAGRSRSFSPKEMQEQLVPALAALRDSGAPIAHYKICSTFDSSPDQGSIGKAIEVGRDIFGTRSVPVVGGAPSLGRYCVFGNLFAACGTDRQVHRLDRHPSMRNHPTTPMDEADLRLHLSRQTSLGSALVDIRTIEDGPDDAIEQYRALAREGVPIILLDLLNMRQLATIGAILASAGADGNMPVFVVGPSSVEEALCAHWRDTGLITGEAAFPTLEPAEPMLVVSGSCSPVTAQQIRTAVAAGFGEWIIDPHTSCCQAKSAGAACRIAAMLTSGRSVIVHTNPAANAGSLDRDAQRRLGETLGWIAESVLQRFRVRRMVVAGGDTSGQVAAALRIRSMEMLAPLVRGVPLCLAHAPDSPADGLQIAFKGGQIGPPDFFVRVQRGAVA